MERGKVKCHKYWPKKAEEIQYWGSFQVKNTGETITEDHFIRQKLELSYEGQTRTVYHFKFTQVKSHFVTSFDQIWRHSVKNNVSRSEWPHLTAKWPYNNVLF